MPAAGTAADVDDDGESADHLREAGPSGAPALYQQLSHDCEGARCLCQRYENGELAAAVLNFQGRNGDADGYQNIPQRGGGHRQRANNQAPNLLNPNYQNPLDSVQPGERRPRDAVENIYERLDEVGQDRGEPDHTYERVDDHRAWYRRTRYRAAGAHHEANLEARRLPGPSCLSRLGRNCFSTENIASAAMSNRRHVYQLGNGCSCQFCRHLDARPVACQYCRNYRDRWRYQESGGGGGGVAGGSGGGGGGSGFGNSRHYIYQLSRSCRCPLCRDDPLYARLEVDSRLSESFRRECHCRNPGSCSCRSRFLSYSNPAIYIGRINQAVNNPLYANPAGAGAGESGQSAEAAGVAARPGSSGPVCPGNQPAERQRVSDDSCTRTNQNGNNGVYQLLGRCERAECHHGRVSIHWVFVNKWLPSWGAQDSVPEAEAEAEAEADADADADAGAEAGADPEPANGREEPREQPNSDAEES